MLLYANTFSESYMFFILLTVKLHIVFQMPLEREGERERMKECKQAEFPLYQNVCFHKEIIWIN